METILAHVMQDKGVTGAWHSHDLAEHCQAVANQAAVFATFFGADEWANLAGLWHDLGKYQPAFQRYLNHNSGYDPEAHLEGKLGKLPHSTAGAKHAIERFGKLGRILAYLIAGHHAGLPDWSSADGNQGALHYRLENAGEEYAASVRAANLPEGYLSQPCPGQKPMGGSPGFALWLRILFSCLVDADFLDTEAFMSPGRTEQRGRFTALPDLQAALTTHLDEKAQSAVPTPINQARSEVLAHCRAAAALPPGFFTLTVPTGGGKTLSSLAFALAHAMKHGKSRVIYGIPFTSIIEQTADVFRKIFGEAAVVEHHSNLDPDQETAANRLAAENWDASLVVTTNVQLFESLFAARTSRARKLHNLVNAVIVLDEAQTLPREFLQPVLDALNLLVKHYGVTVVLCTATQPALGSRTDAHGQYKLRGIDTAHEIIPDPVELYARLRRVTVQPLPDWCTPTPWLDLAAHVAQHPTALAIVSQRKHARELYQHLRAAVADPGGTCFHLSALMCGEHRSQVLKEIKSQLSTRHLTSPPLYVVSTQVIEAGVDMDFPVVYRAMAGLDSLAQAAGRCNREGRQEQGTLYVFHTEGKPMPGVLGQGEATARELLGVGLVQDVLAPDAYCRYFELLYSKGNLDEKNICGRQLQDAQQGEVPFRSIAEDFRLIADEGRAVLVPYLPPGAAVSPVKGLLKKLEQNPSDRWVYRKLRRYTVSVPEYSYTQLVKNNRIEIVGELPLALDYDPVIGLILPDEPLRPSSLVG